VSRSKYATGYRSCEPLPPLTIILLTVYVCAVLIPLAWESSVKMRSGVLYWGMLYLKIEQ
jgi:hypothetical protein